MKFEGWNVTQWVTVALVGMVVALLLASGWNEASVRAVVRATARTSVSLFLLAFTAASLCLSWPNRTTRWLRRNRRYVGVSFAISQLVHLAALVVLALDFPEPFVSDLNALTIVGGGGAYLFAAAMAFTSSDRAVARLGRRRWRLLHVVGGYYNWGIFAQSYLPRAAEDPAYLPVSIAVLVGFALRFTPRARAAARNARR